LRYAARRVQRTHHRREAAYEVLPGTANVAENEHADGAQLPQGYACTHADQLLRHASIDGVAQSIERETAHVDRADTREVDDAVAIDGEEELVVLIPEQLNVDAIARTDDIARRHGNIVSRLERASLALEQIVAERHERGGADRPKR